MLTCPQILTEATQYCPEITEDNYKTIATLIHPQCEWHPPHKLGSVQASPFLTMIYTALDNLPEVAEANTALEYHTTDYTDQVIRLVTLWQCNVAKFRYWTDHVIPTMTNPSAIPPAHTATYHQDTFNNHRACQAKRLRTWAYQPDDDRWPGHIPTPSAPELDSRALASDTEPNYHITLTYTGPGATTIFLQSVTSPSRTTADTIVTQLLKLLADNTWRFSITHEIGADTAQSTPARAASRPAPANTPVVTATDGNQNEDSYIKIPF